VTQRRYDRLFSVKRNFPYSTLLLHRVNLCCGEGKGCGPSSVYPERSFGFPSESPLGFVGILSLTWSVCTVHFWL